MLIETWVGVVLMWSYISSISPRLHPLDQCEKKHLIDVAQSLTLGHPTLCPCITNGLLVDSIQASLWTKNHTIGNGILLLKRQVYPPVSIVRV